MTNRSGGGRDGSKKKPSKRGQVIIATDPQVRLERAITYWIEHKPIATLEEIKRVANKFGVHWKSLREAIRLLPEEKKR